MIRKYTAKYLLPAIIGLVASLLAGIAVNTVSWLGHLELRTNQQRLVKNINVQPSSEVILIQIKEETPGLLGLENQTLPLPRRFHAELLNGMKRAQARAVVFDLVFSGHTRPVDDDALRQALDTSSPMSVTLAARLTNSERDSAYPTGWKYSFTMPDILPDPLPGNVVIASPVVFNPANKLDGAVLMMPNAETGGALPYLAFSAALSRLGDDVSDAKWDMSRGLITAGRSTYPVGQDGELHAIWTKKQFKQIEYSEAIKMLNTAEGIQEFNKKTVIIGTAVMGEDTHVSPIGEIYGMVFVGQMLNTLLQPEVSLVKRWRIPTNTIWAWMLAFAVSALIITLRPRVIAIGLPVCIAIAFLFPSLMLGAWYIWVDTVGPVMAISLAVIFSALLSGTRSSALVQRFMPRHVREQRLTAQTEQATVLFVDLRNSTSIANQIGPEAAQQIQSELLERLSKVITQNGGEVERTLGDGLMAVFRSKGTWKHSLKCINSIQPLQEAAAIAVSRFKDEHGVTTGVTIGVESGVISGTVVMADREEWSSFGPTVNLAARLQGACGEFGVAVLIGPGANSLIRQEIKTKFLGAANLKGIEEPTPVYTIDDNP